MWMSYEEVCTLSLTKFEKICEKIVGKKLVKDSKIRISKTTIKSFFNMDTVKEVLHEEPESI